MAPPVFLRVDIWSDLACFSGVRQAFVDDILALTATRTIDNRDELTLTVGRANRIVPFLVKLAVIRLVMSDTAFDEEWRITGITQDQVRGTVVVTCDWPLIDLATRALLCSTPALVTDDQAPYAFEAIGLTPAQHWDNYVLRGFPAAWSGKVARGTFDVVTPQDLVYDWDKPRKIIGDLAQLTNTEISYRRNGSTSYLLDLLTAIGSSAPVLDVRLGKNIAGITVKEDENQRATTVFPRSALVDGVSYGLAQNRWRIAAMSAGAKTIDLVDPAGKAGPIAFDGQFGTTGLAWRVFKANGPPVSASNRIITTSTVVNQRLTVSVDPTLVFVVGDLLCFGTVDGSSNYAPIWSLNDGPQAITDPPVAVLKRDDVVAGINLVPNPVMRAWTGLSSDPPDSWLNMGGSTPAVITKRTTAADYQSGGASCRVQTTLNGRGIETGLTAVTPTTGAPYFTAFVRFRIDALTGGAKVQVSLWAESFSGPIVVRLYPNTWGAAQSAADSDQIGVWITLAISVPLLNGVGSCTLTAERLKLLIEQAGAGTADFTVDAAQITQTSYQLPLIEGASGNVLWQAANELITDQRAAQREYQVDLVDLASADPTAFPYDQIQLGQTLRVTDPDLGLSAVPLRLLGLTRDHVTEGALTPAKVRVTVGTVAPSAANLLAGSALNGRQGPVSAVGGAGSRIGNAPVLPPDFSASVQLGFYDIRSYLAFSGATLGSQHAEINAAIIAANAAGGGIVVVPPGIWMVDPDKAGGAGIELLDNVTLWIMAGATLRSIATGLDLYGVVWAVGRSNVAVIGEGTIDGNRAAHIGATGESGMCLWFAGCDGVKVRDIQCINGWGDGIYLGDNGTTPNTNVDLFGVVCDGNRRQGVSVVGVKGGVIQSCWFLNTSGTAPSAGIDLEPNNAGNVDGVLVSDCVALDNAGAGFLMTTTSKNSRIHHCYSARNAKNGISIAATGGGNVVDHCTVADLTASTRGAIDVASGTIGCRLLGNTVRNITTGFAAYYIHGTATGCEVTDNHVSDVIGAEGFTINAPDTIVHNNTGEDIGGIGLDVTSSGDRCSLTGNTMIRCVGRGFYLAGDDCLVEGNTALDISTVSGGMFQFVGVGAQAIGNRAILTTPNAAVVPFLFTGAAAIKVGNLGIGTQAYIEVVDRTLIPYMGSSAYGLNLALAAGDRVGASQYAILADITSGSDAVSAAIGLYARTRTTPATYTQALAACLYADAIVKGAGSTITKAVGLFLAAQTVGATNWSLETAAGGNVKIGGLLQLLASAAGGAGLNLASGVAPTTPNNGDIWLTTAGMFCRAGGVTFGPFATAGVGGSGSAGKLAKFSAASTIADSILSEAGTVATIAGELDVKRVRGTGTAHVAGDYALSAGWGTTASVSAVAARDSGGRVTITCLGTGQAASPTVTLTFKDGTWGTPPALVAGRGDIASPAGDWRLTAISATAAEFTLNGTPVSGSVYVLDWIAVGK